MSLMYKLFTKKKKGKSANIVRDRLQIIIGNNVNSKSISPDTLKEIELDIIKTLQSKLGVTKNSVNVRVNKSKSVKQFSVSINLPEL